MSKHLEHIWIDYPDITVKPDKGIVLSFNIDGLSITGLQHVRDILAAKYDEVKISSWMGINTLTIADGLFQYCVSSVKVKSIVEAIEKMYERVGPAGLSEDSE